MLFLTIFIIINCVYSQPHINIPPIDTLPIDSPRLIREEDSVQDRFNAEVITAIEFFNRGLHNGVLDTTYHDHLLESIAIFSKASFSREELFSSNKESLSSKESTVHFYDMTKSTPSFTVVDTHDTNPDKVYMMITHKPYSVKYGSLTEVIMIISTLRRVGYISI